MVYWNGRLRRCPQRRRAPSSAVSRCCCRAIGRQLGPLATSSMRGGTQHAGVSFWKPSCYAGASIHDIQLERVDKIGDRFFEAASRRLVAHIGRSGLQANWSAYWGSAAFSGTPAFDGEGPSPGHSSFGEFPTQSRSGGSRTESRPGPLGFRCRPADASPRSTTDQTCPAA
jgi:hypothetical protein